MTELSKIELDGAHPHMPADPVELGALMRELRTAAKRDLKDVAQELRIRQPYLEAIEDGRLDDLPGPAYTTGFLRAYSEFLGLDGHAVIERVKEAGLDIDKRASLVLPSPVEDGSLPTSSLLLVAAMLAVVAYAGWYYVWTDDSAVVDPVGPMPAELASLSGMQSAPARPAASAPTAAPAAVDPVAAPRDAAESAPAVADSTDAAAPAKVADAGPTDAAATTTRQPVPVAPKPVASPAAPTPAPKVAAIVRPAEKPPVVARVASAPRTGATVAAAQPVVRTEPWQPRTVAPPSARTPSQAPTATAAATPAAPAAPVEKRRIRIRATADSWVEIRDSKGDPLMSKLMQDGDSFDLESRPGLKLVTGNAGGLEVFVDAKKVAPLGPVGEILQNVPIDADSLLKR